ncbi:class I adenylate-forming enzyme family protein [Agrococcus sp. ARC_14]|uniref:class I adenylate-forming enzyme family protein n=1 Tax=Agrococcus sp. ARC_14 TaxID=2919927 RepID=UPI001F060024|nr:class I adenylate-forming enzyme family protein [Agrococcus sp. ARC_14]MCH1882423.1 acyl--CoA ligase [Agrococcus sp. ARC_14]
MLEAVLAATREHAPRPALTFGDRTIAFGQLGARIERIAAGLADAGMRPGDRVAFSVRPSIDAVVLALAVCRAGGQIAFVDLGAGPELLAARLALAQPQWTAAESLLHLVSAPGLRRIARSRGIDLPAYRELLPDARHIVTGPRLPGAPRGALRLAALARTAARQLPPADPSADALLIFTSGTTGTPKTVLHTLASLGAGLADIRSGLGLEPGMAVLTDQLMIGIPALIAGSHWTLPPAGLDPAASPERYLPLLDAAETVFASPAGLDAILRLLDERPAPAHDARLRVIALGGAPVLPPLIERALTRFPDARVRCVYGMSEILPVAIADGAEKLHASGDGDYVGTIASSVDARIEDGELVLAGPGLARAYLHELPQQLDAVRTGDLARIDGDRLTLLGRKKDMLLRGTQNIYVGLYEPIIASLPGVADAAMVGVPDAIGDDRIVVAIVPDGAPEDLPADPAHPLARRVAAALPGLIDHGALPDLVVAIGALPRRGRMRKPDRPALVALVTGLVGAAAASPGRDELRADDPRPPAR